MISAIQEHARKTPQPADAALVEMTANYLQACHLIFEKVILSNLTMTERYQQVLENIKKGFSFFTDWSFSHQRTGKCIALIMIQSFFTQYLDTQSAVCSTDTENSFVLLHSSFMTESFQILLFMKTKPDKTVSCE